MKRHPPEPRERALVAAFLLLLLFATPFTRIWADPRLPWYLPYLLWAMLILLMAWPRRRRTGRRKGS